MADSLEQILSQRVVPVATVESAEDAVALAGAVRDGGMNVIEFAFRTDASADAARAVREAHPDMHVGAGTLLTPGQVEEAHDAGCVFGVAPGLSERVVRAAQSVGMPLIPGVATPTEIERALELDCTVLKLFPANILGGPDFLKSISGPYARTGVKFIITGGVNAASMGEYLALPIVSAVFGSWFVNKELVRDKNWAQITEYTRGALDVCTKLLRP